MAKSRLNYTLKVPGNGRRTFAIVVDKKTSSGARVQSTLKDPRVAAINKQISTGQIDTPHAEIELRKLIDDLYAQYDHSLPKTSTHTFNAQTAEKYFEDVVSVRPLKDPIEPYNKLMRAVRLMGNLSLRTASAKDIQKRLNTLVGTPQRKALTAISGMLRFIGRLDVKLYRADDPDVELQYLTEAQFDELRRAIPSRPHLDDLLVIAFGTGARLGEVIGMRVEDLGQRNGLWAIHIQRQTIRPLMQQFNGGNPTRLPKGKRKRWVAPLRDDTITAFKRWVEVSAEEREKLRYISSELLRDTAERLWPNIPHTHGGVHMLRKSHCLALLLRGATVSGAAYQLGDSEAVVQKHYAGFVHTDESLMALQNILARK